VHLDTWSIEAHGQIVFSDSAEHAALVQRILRVDESLWRRAVEEYGRMLQGDHVDARLRALRQAWDLCSPHAGTLPQTADVLICPICGNCSVTPILSRASAEVYGLCGDCGHGVLLSPPTEADVYRKPDYYEQRSDDGVGYEAYRQEQSYREAKAERLLNWIEGRSARPIASMLEVGSGYGFSRAAAERRGWCTMGVDLNPHAATACRDLYGIETFTGTLEQALASGAISKHSWDLVLYQFVLEHVADPIAELRQAAEAVAATGGVALLVPSMQAAERVVFGASYRSLRPDHLHLFSWKSLDICMAKAGLRRDLSRSECSVHLLAGFLTQEELATLYENGDGPDLIAVAARR
jgi:SAM-dependent methyltransferase